MKLINYGLKKDGMKSGAFIYIENVENSEIDLILIFYSFYIHRSEYYRLLAII